MAARNLSRAAVVFSAPPSRGRRTRAARIRQSMERFISPILVMSVLDRAILSRGLVDRPLTTGDLNDIVEEAMVGLRLFVPDAKLPALMLELAEILDEEDP